MIRLESGWRTSLINGVLFADAEFYFGSCPGTDFDTVFVIVSPTISIDDSGIPLQMNPVPDRMEA